MKIKGITLPDNLGSMATEFMKSIITRLDKEGRLDNLDQLSLFMLASNINKFIMCENEFNGRLTTDSARGNETVNAVLTYQKQIQGNIAVLLKEMGLTLGSRSKMKSPEQGAEESPLLTAVKALQDET